MRSLTVWAPGPTALWVAAGQLNFVQNELSFRYLDSWLDNPWAYSLDPMHLPLAPIVYHGGQSVAALALFNHLLPLGWAAVLMRNSPADGSANSLYSQFKHLPPGLTPIRLSVAGADLTEVTLTNWNNLESLCQKARAQNSQDVSVVRLHEYLAGGCWQGARPKITVQGESSIWLGKWQNANEAINWPQIEYANLELLQQSGFNVPKRHLIPTEAAGWIYLIERFDLRPLEPEYFISAATLLGGQALTPQAKELLKPEYQELDARRDPISYIGFARCLRKYSSAAKTDLHALFRHLLANVMLNNTQDHPHKLGMIYKPNSRQWRLAPCFGVRPSPFGGPHAMAIGCQGRQRSLANALSLAAEFALTPAQAKSQLEQVRESLSQWRAVFEHCGVGGRDLQWLSQVVRCEDF